MKVFHFGGKTECSNLEDLNSILTNRHENNVNEFELYGDEKYPYLTVLVNDQWACVHYFESEDDCGHYAYCNENLLNEDDYTTFYIGSPTAETEISNNLVIPFSLAIEIAQDFFIHLKMSEKVKWFEL
jgi:hypothetical protein